MMKSIGLGFRAQKGGSVVVAVAMDKREPHVLFSTFLTTAAEGVLLSLEPYHVAAAMKRGPGGAPSKEAAAAVAEGRKLQDKLANTGLKDIVRQLTKMGYEPAVAALLVNRAGWVTDLLTYSLAFADHPPVAEGLAVRDALRFAIARQKIVIAEMDEKSLHDVASKALALEPNLIDARLKAIGAGAKPWRREQKLACLAAWVAVAGRAR